MVGRGALLPPSDAPGVREEREHLCAGVRRAVLHHGDVDSLWTLARTGAGHLDTELVGRLRKVLPADDPRHADLANG